MSVVGFLWHFPPFPVPLSMMTWRGGGRGVLTSLGLRLHVSSGGKGRLEMFIGHFEDFSKAVDSGMGLDIII